VQGLDPRRLAERQLQIVRERTLRFPFLLAHALARTSGSPLALLRGGAQLFYEILAADRDPVGNSRASGWIVGDAHLENFGAFRPAAPADERLPRQKSVFDLNDFDQAVEGPWRWDVLRLTTSLILAGRELGVDGPTVLNLAEKLIDSHVATAFEGAGPPPTPAPVAALVTRVATRSKQELLGERTAVALGKRRFVRGARYRDVPGDLVQAVPGALATYLSRLAAHERPTPEQLELVDVAFRVAGTGSLGALRLAVLTRGKGGVDGGWIFDLKEQSLPAAAPLLGPAAAAGAERVARASVACLERPPLMLATTELAGLSLLVRRLAPQEDKLKLQRLERADLAPLAGYLGWLLGKAHARGAAPSTRLEPWSSDERADVLARAVALAGLHEAVYLELCLLARTQQPTSQ
jgi:uncharacterized protein (DUF2252 family)